MSIKKRTDSLHLTLSGDRFTPYSLAKKLNAVAVLESASFSQGKARYSILMLSEAFRIRQEPDGVYLIINGDKRLYPGNPRDILDVLHDIAAENEAPENNIPLPASGIGYLSFEFSARCDTIVFPANQADSLGIPEAEFMVGHIYIIFDHFNEKLHLFALNYREHEIDLEEAVRQVKLRLEDDDFSYLAPPKPIPAYSVLTDESLSKRQYLEKIDILKHHLVEGDIIQAVPSRRLQLKSGAEALDIYRRLRSITPSPYLFYLDFKEFQLLGASPESLIKVKNKVASVPPIAGTARRGKNEMEDARLKSELLANPKERAEHLMLLDLARNDLGRVCEAGTVAVTKNTECEMFSHVMHLVSEVQGKLESGKHSVDALRSVFPAGTVSGAPKISAIEILSRIEPEKRNFYAGAVGYLQSNGDLDFCIAIRSALKQGDTWTLQSGGGIVHASDPEREWEETNEKLMAMRAVFEGSIQ